VYHIGTQNINKKAMLVISTREFRQKQKMYLDLVDKNEQVIVQRGKNKAYVLTRITEADRYFSDPEIKMRIANSIEQAERGELTTLPKEDINKFLGV
jgi:antitoxin YefM